MQKLNAFSDALGVLCGSAVKFNVEMRRSESRNQTALRLSRLCRPMCGGGYASPINGLVHFGLRPWYGLLPRSFITKAPAINWTKPEPGGIAQTKKQLTARHSHRRKSGG